MQLRTRLLIGICLLSLALGAQVTAAHAVGGSIAITVPATNAAKTDINVVYEGTADASDQGETGAVMLHSFYAKDAADCAPTVAAQRARSGSNFEGQQYVGAPAPTPFSFTSLLFLPEEGTYRICAYLGGYPVDENAAPYSVAQTVLKVGAASTPCVVPNVKGQTLKAATRRLKVAGCVVGRVFKPRRVPKKRTLIVKSQSVKADVMVAAGSKVNLTLRLKAK